MIILRVHMLTLHLALGRSIQGLGHRDKIMFEYPASSTPEQKKKSQRRETQSKIFSRELLERPNHYPKPGVGAKKENGNKHTNGLKCEQIDTHLG